MDDKNKAEIDSKTLLEKKPPTSKPTSKIGARLKKLSALYPSTQSELVPSTDLSASGSQEVAVKPALVSRPEASQIPEVISEKD